MGVERAHTLHQGLGQMVTKLPSKINILFQNDGKNAVNAMSLHSDVWPNQVALIDNAGASSYIYIYIYPR